MPGWRERLRAAFTPRSLARQLLLWLLLPQLVLWMAAAWVTFNVAEAQARRGIDASLLQATRSLSRQVKPVGNGLFIDFPRAAQDIIEADPDDRVFYMVSTPPGQFILGNLKLPLPPPELRPQPNVPLFYDARVERRALRVSALFVPIGPTPGDLMLVQIARNQANQDELVRSILADTVLPLSLLILAMTAIVGAGIRRGLLPLTRLRRQVEHRAPDDLAPLELDAAPLELRSLAGALNALLGAVQESVRAQGRFISHAAHQLRTPLAGLKSQTELALQVARQRPDDTELIARLERVHASAVRSAHLVNQMLTLSRAEPEAASTVPREPVDLRALAASVTSDMVPRALQAGVDLGLAEPPGPDDRLADPATPGGSAHVLGSTVLLREAVVNLVDNAIRYAGTGTEVTVAVRPDGDRVRLSVTDNGRGLDDDQRQRALERFVRLNESGPGCGLGLPIVAEIAQRHRGEFRLEAASPHGLRAVIDLPRLPGESSFVKASLS